MDFDRDNVTPQFVARFASSRRTYDIRNMNVQKDLFDWPFLMANGAKNCDPFMTGSEYLELYEAITKGNVNHVLDPLLCELPLEDVKDLISIGVDVVRVKREAILEAPTLPEQVEV